MNKIIELHQDFESLQEAWHKLYNQLQILNYSATIKSDMQLIENKIDKIQSDIINLNNRENISVPIRKDVMKHLNSSISKNHRLGELLAK